MHNNGFHGIAAKNAAPREAERYGQCRSLRIVMETYDKIRELISSETIEDNIDVRTSFLNLYRTETDEFICNMSKSFIAWRSLDSRTKNDEQKEHLSALVFSSINLHIVSMKLFLSGYIVPAGKIERQAIETIALAILLSNKGIDIFDIYIKNQYSTNKAVRDLKRHSKKMSLSEEGINKLEKAHKHFHDYSHPSYITIGSNFNFQGKGRYLGASFDEGKIDFYNKDISGRVNLSAVFPNYIKAVESAIINW